MPMATGSKEVRKEDEDRRQPVTSNQVYAVAMRFPEMFVKDRRLIRLMV